MLIILTGPPAAGKSTVGATLARRLPRSVNFSLDTIRHFVVGDHRPPWEDSDEARRQLWLAEAVAHDLLRLYLGAGFAVVMDDVLGDAEAQRYADEFGETHAFLLLPSLDVLKRRDAARPPDQRMGRRIDELYPEFAGRPHPVLQLIDSSGQTATETAELILRRLGLG